MAQAETDDRGIFICPICGARFGFDSQGQPYHFGCNLDGDHEVCDPDDRHIPVG